MDWDVLDTLAQPGPINGAWTAATIANRLQRSPANAQRALIWLSTAGLAVLLPKQPGSQLQLYTISDAGVAKLRESA
jgi:hypothetical protein